MPADCCKKFYASIPDDEPVFTIAARDKLAPGCVAKWIADAIKEGVPLNKVQRASKHLTAILEWQQANPDKVKLPD